LPLDQFVRADEGDFLVRLRAVQMDFAQKSDAIPSLEVPADAIRIDNQTIPDANVKYMKLQSDVKTANFGKVSTVNLDPWLFGVGIGYRF
jgi:outer membrane protein W